MPKIGIPHLSSAMLQASINASNASSDAEHYAAVIDAWLIHTQKLLRHLPFRYTPGNIFGPNGFVTKWSTKHKVLLPLACQIMSTNHPGEIFGNLDIPLYRRHWFVNNDLITPTFTMGITNDVAFCIRHYGIWGIEDLSLIGGNTPHWQHLVFQFEEKDAERFEVISVESHRHTTLEFLQHIEPANISQLACGQAVLRWLLRITHEYTKRMHRATQQAYLLEASTMTAMNLLPTAK